MQLKYVSHITHNGAFMFQGDTLMVFLPLTDMPFGVGLNGKVFESLYLLLTIN